MLIPIHILGCSEVLSDTIVNDSLQRGSTFLHASPNILLCPSLFHDNQHSSVIMLCRGNCHLQLCRCNHQLIPNTQENSDTEKGSSCWTVANGEFVSRSISEDKVRHYLIRLVRHSAENFLIVSNQIRSSDVSLSSI